MHRSRRCEEGCDNRKRRLTRVTRYFPVSRLKWTWDDGDCPTRCGFNHREVRSCEQQHLFCVGSRQHRFVHGGRTDRTESCEQDRRLHLRTRLRNVVGDATQWSSHEGNRRQDARTVAAQASAHQRQWPLHSVHWTLRQGCITDERVLARHSGDQPGHEAHGSSRIAAVEGLGRGAEDSSGGHRHEVTVSADRCTKCCHDATSVLQVLAVTQSGDGAPSRSERCEHERSMRDRLVAGRRHDA